MTFLFGSAAQDRAFGIDIMIMFFSAVALLWGYFKIKRCLKIRKIWR